MKNLRFLSLILVIGLLAACASSDSDTASQPVNGLLVSGGDIQKTYTRADLEALPPVQANFNGVDYLGVSAASLLQDAGFDLQQVKAVKAIASDGFTVNYDPSQFMADGFSVAYATVGGELTADDGSFRIVFPGAEGKLNPRMLKEIQVIR